MPVHFTSVKWLEPSLDRAVSLLVAGQSAAAVRLLDDLGSHTDLAERLRGDSTVDGAERRVARELVSRVRAYALSESGNAERAIESYRIAIEMAPYDGRLHFRLAQNFHRRGRISEALVAYRAAAERAGGDTLLLTRSWGALGSVSASLGRMATAVFYWDKVLTLDSLYFTRQPEEGREYERALRSSGMEWSLKSRRAGKGAQPARDSTSSQPIPRDP
jgi:tetratricopeptide (TPR) repeat protein